MSTAAQLAKRAQNRRRTRPTNLHEARPVEAEPVAPACIPAIAPTPAPAIARGSAPASFDVAREPPQPPARHRSAGFYQELMGRHDRARDLYAKVGKT